MLETTPRALAEATGCNPNTVRRFLTRLRGEGGPGSGYRVTVSEAEARKFRLYVQVQGTDRYPEGFETRQGVLEAAFRAIEDTPEGWVLIRGRAGSDGAEVFPGPSPRDACLAAQRYLDGDRHSSVVLLHLG
jgi:hypothetical protein